MKFLNHENLELYGTCTMYGKHTPVPRIEYTCTTHGICLYHASDSPVPCMEYTSTTHGICMK